MRRASFTDGQYRPLSIEMIVWPDTATFSASASWVRNAERVAPSPDSSRPRFLLVSHLPNLPFSPSRDKIPSGIKKEKASRFRPTPR